VEKILPSRHLYDLNSHACVDLCVIGVYISLSSRGKNKKAFRHRERVELELELIL